MLVDAATFAAVAVAALTLRVRRPPAGRGGRGGAARDGGRRATCSPTGCWRW